MWLKFILAMWLGTKSMSVPVTNNACTADNTLWFVYDYFPCSKLQDPTDRMGIYKTRKARCEAPGTDCCITCEKVRKEFECEDEHSGVWLADGGYPCSKLNDENDRLGIYANRDSLCTQKEINCCVTCKPILQAASECINKVNGAYFNHGTHDCTLLLDKTDSSGVYVNRASICADTKTKCCPSCKQVQKESQTTVPPGSVTTPATIVGGNPVNQGCERHVWIAGGAYDCSYLTDTSNKHGIYEGRHNLCDTGSADCCITCREVRKENRTTIKVTESPTTHPTTRRLGGIIVGGNPISNDCERQVWFASGSYQCSDLLNPQDTNGIYDNRHRFCADGTAQCCITCNKVREETPTPAKQTATKNTTPPSNRTPTGTVTQCKDEWILVHNRYMDCGRLRDTSNSYDIYRRRVELCQSDASTKCCQTCQQILQGAPGKPDGMKNNNENIVIKPEVNIQIPNAAPSKVFPAQPLTNLRPQAKTTVNNANTELQALQTQMMNSFNMFFRLLAQYRDGMQMRVNV